jgi:glycosyltransferase involved in cell wall biosynthesis
MIDNSISVIVNYCAADACCLRRCLASISWQLSAKDELVVVYDGNISDSECQSELERMKRGLHEFQDPLSPRVFWVVSSSGISKARNVGASHSNGRWLKFIDVDDVLAPFALNAIRESEFPNNFKVVRGGQTTIWNGQFNHEQVPSSRKDYLREEGIWIFKAWESILTHNPAIVSHTFIDRESFNAVGGFQERIHYEEDWDLWFRMLRMFGPSAFGAIRARICYYWISDDERGSKKRCREVDGMDVREYLRREYGATPAEE